MPRHTGFLSLIVCLTCCGSPGATALHRMAALTGTPDEDFYALPFPSDLRRRDDGTLDLSGYPRPAGQVGLYVAEMDGRIPGAGTSAAVYFRFDAPIDPASLPDARQSLSPSASAFIVDITESSPDYGQRTPILASFTEEEGAFIGPNWLALTPFPGIPLRERTTYAALLLDGLRAADGGKVQRAAELDVLLSEQEPEVLVRAWKTYAPLRRYLERHDLRARVVGAAQFTTQDTTSLMHRLREAVYRQPAPRVSALRYVRDHDGLCHIYHGSYEQPNFQRGTPPYLGQGGDILMDEAGGVAVARTEPMRFALSVPNAPMPAAGWPVILYAHGTGGSYESFIREGIDLVAAHVELDGRPLSRMAVISIDQVLHGERDPTFTPPELTFFNLKNIIAARDNPKQGAADLFQLLRLVKSLSVDAAPGTGRPLRFDARHIYFMGHSQGGLTGPLFLAAEPAVRAAVLSGAGAVLVLSLLYKTEPADVASLVTTLLGEPATEAHPLLNLLQAFFESSDPGNYGRLLFREPPSGHPPKSIFQSLGLTDRYTPVPTISAFALSMGVQPIAPLIAEIPGLDLVGIGWGSAPTAGNVAGGAATGVLRQYRQKGRSDGHFVIFDHLASRHDWSRFLGTDISSGLAQLLSSP